MVTAYSLVTAGSTQEPPEALGELPADYDLSKGDIWAAALIAVKLLGVDREEVNWNRSETFPPFERVVDARTAAFLRGTSAQFYERLSSSVLQV